MAKAPSETRSGGGSEAERRYDGGGQDAPLDQSEAARGNVEPAVDAPAADIPPEKIAGRDGKPITIDNDSGVAWAEAETKPDPAR